MTFDAALPVFAATLVWWFSTGAILWLDRRPRHTFAWSLTGASVLAALAIVALAVTATRTDPAGAYIAFGAAVALWGWHEMSFLMGFIAGPRTTPCPREARGWRRFRLAAATLIHHEIAVALTALALIAFTWGQANQVGAATFALLWGMRLSAKFNLFLGAPHRGEALLPPHLAYLGSYFRAKRMNALFPVSMLVGGALAAAFAARAFAPGASAFDAAANLLLLTMTALALIEHVFMFVPPPTQMLWGWAAPAKLEAND